MKTIHGVFYGKFRIIFLMCILLSCVLSVRAQNFSISGVSDTLTACGSSSVYTLNMQSITGPANYTFSIRSTAPGLYIQSTGNINSSSSLVTIQNPTNKVFSINIPSSVVNQNVTITFDLYAGYCNIFPLNVSQINIISAFELTDNATTPNPNVYLSNTPTISVKRGASLSYENIPELRTQYTNAANNGLVTITHKITNTSTTTAFNGKVLFWQDSIGTAFDIRKVEFVVDSSVIATKTNPVVNYLLNQNDNTFIASSNDSNSVIVSLTSGQTLDIIETVRVNGCIDSIIQKSSHPQISWGCTVYDMTCGAPLDQNLTEQILSNISPIMELDKNNPSEFTSDLLCTGDASNSAGRNKVARYTNIGNGPANKMRFYIKSSSNAPVYIPAVPENIFITIKRGSTSTNYDPNLTKYDIPTTTYTNASQLPPFINSYIYTAAVGLNSGNTSVSSRFVQIASYTNGNGLNICNTKLTLNDIGINQNNYRFSTGCLANGFNDTLYRGLIIDEYWDPVRQTNVPINLEPGDQIEIHWKEYNGCYKEQFTEGIILEGTDVKCWFDNGCGTLMDAGRSSTSYTVNINQTLYASNTTTQGDLDYCLSTQDGRVEHISSKLTIPDWNFSNTSSIFDTDNGTIKIRFFLERGLDLDKKLTKPYDFGWIDKYGYKDPESPTGTGCNDSCTGCPTSPHAAYMYDDNANNFYVRLRKGTIILRPTSVALIDFENSSTVTIPFSTEKGNKAASLLYEATFALDSITSLEEEVFLPNTTSPLEKIKYWLSNAFLDFDLRAYCGLDNSSFKEILYLDLDCGTEGSCGPDIDPTSYNDNFVNMLPLSSVDGSMMINCPGCLIPGANVNEVVPLRRLNIGMRDENGDGIPDDSSSIPTNYLETRLTVQGDVMESILSVTMSDGESNVVSPPNHSLLKLELDNADYNLNNLYIRIDRPSAININSLEASLNNGSWVPMTQVEDTTMFEVYNITIGEVSDSLFTTFSEGNNIQIRVNFEVGNLGPEFGIQELVYLAGFSPMERSNYVPFRNLYRVAGKLDSILYDATTIAYTKAQLLTVNNTFFQCTSASTTFTYFPFLEQSSADINQYGGCERIIRSSFTGHIYNNSSKTPGNNLFDREFRTFNRVGITGTKRRFVTEIPIPAGYTATNLSNNNHNQYQNGPNKITQDYSINNPLTNLPSGNALSAQVVTTSDSSFPSRLRITFTYSTVDELTIDDKYLLSTYNQTNQNSAWPFISYSWPSVSNPILAFDEYVETSFNLTVIPDVSCSSLPSNGYDIYDDSDTSTKNEITSNVRDFNDNNSISANPNENNSIGTPGNLPVRVKTRNFRIIDKPKAILTASSINLPLVKGKKLELTIKMKSMNGKAEYPFLYIQTNDLVNQGFVLEGVYMGQKNNYAANPKYPLIEQSGGNYLIGIDKYYSISGSPSLEVGVEYDYTMVFTYTCPATCNVEVNCGTSDTTYNGCLSGSIYVSYGYSCGSFPANISQVGSSCDYHTLTPAYTISNEPVALDVTYYVQREVDTVFVAIENDETIEELKPCTDFKYRVNLNSCQNGSFNEYHIKFNHLPAGFIPVPTVNSTTPITDNKSNQYYVTYDTLNSYFLVKPVSNNFDEGVINLNVDFNFDLPCVVSDEEIDVQVTGVSYCGVLIEREIVNPIQLGLYDEQLDSISIAPTNITVSDTTLTIGCILDGIGNNGANTLYENGLLVEVRNGNILVQTDTLVIPVGTANGYFSDSVSLPSVCADYTVTVIPLQGFVPACSTSTLPDCANLLRGIPVTKDSIIVSGSITAIITTLTNDAPFLCGGSMQLEVNPKGNNFSYSWVNTLLPLNVLGTNDHLLTSQGGIYRVTVSDTTNGCTSSQASFAVVDSIEVDTIMPVCRGENPTIQLLNKASGNSIIGNYQAQWYRLSDDSLMSEGITATGYYYAIAISNISSPSCTLSTVSAPSYIELKQSPQPYVVEFGEITGNYVLHCPVKSNGILLKATDTTRGINSAYLNPLQIVWNDWERTTYTNTLPDTIRVNYGGTFSLTAQDLETGCVAQSNLLHIGIPQIYVQPSCGSNGTDIDLNVYANYPVTGSSLEWKKVTNPGTSPAIDSLGTGTKMTVSEAGRLYTVEGSFLGCPTGDGFYLPDPIPFNLSGASVNGIEHGDFVTLGGTDCDTNFTINFTTDFLCQANKNADPLEKIGHFMINGATDADGASLWNPHWTGTARNSSSSTSGNEFMLVDGTQSAGDKLVWKKEVSIDHAYRYFARANVRNIVVGDQASISEIPEIWMQVRYGGQSMVSFPYISQGQIIENNSNGLDPWMEFGVFSVADVKHNASPATTGEAETVEISIYMRGRGAIGRDVGIDDVELWPVGLCDNLTTVVPVSPCSGISITDPNLLVCPGGQALVTINNPNPGVTYGYYQIEQDISSSQTVTLDTSNSFQAPVISGTFKNYILVVSGTVCTTRLGFNVRTIDPPQLSIVSVADANSCNNTKFKVLVNGIEDTTYTYVWKVNNGSPEAETSLLFTSPTLEDGDVLSCRIANYNQCSSTTSPVDSLIISGVAFTANAGTDQNICTGDTATIGLAAVSGRVYEWRIASTTAPNSNPVLSISAQPLLSPTATTSYELTVTNTTSGCSSRDEVTITVYSLPIVSAGNDQTVCAGTSVTLSGSGAQDYSWSHGKTNGIPFSASATTTYTVTGTSVNGCENKDSVTITVVAQPTTSNAGADQSVCATTATLAGNTATAGTGSWSIVSGTATITDTASATSEVTGLVVGAVTLRWTISNSPCTASSDDVIITRVGTPTTAAAGSDQSVCASTATLAGNTATTGTGSWSVVSGTATFADAASPTSGVTGLGIGANTLRWTISNSPCTASSEDVIITRAATPTTAAAGTDRSVCGTTFTLEGNTATTGTGSWSVVSGTATITDTTSATSGLTELGVGANTLRWTIRNSPCTASSDDVVITGKSYPTNQVSTGPYTSCQQGQISITYNNTSPAGARIVTPFPSGFNNAGTTISGPVTVQHISFSNITATRIDTLLGETYINGCTTTVKIPVTVNPSPGPPSATITTEHACGKYSVNVSAAASAGTLSYAWSPSTWLSDDTVANPNVSFGNSTPLSYQATVKQTNPNGSVCSKSTSLALSADCKSLYFNGANFVTITNPSNNPNPYELGTNAFTLEAKIRFTSTPSAGTYTIWSRKSGATTGLAFGITYNGTQARIFVQLNNITYTSNVLSNLFNGNCHHITVSRKTSPQQRFNFYYDGDPEGTPTISGTQSISVGTQNALIGVDYGSSNYFTGFIHEVRFWNVERARFDIDVNQNTAFGNPTTNLIGLFRFKEADIQTVSDFSSTNTSGYLGNNTSITSSDPVRSTTGCSGFSGDRIMPGISEEELLITDQTEIIPNPSEDNFNLTIYSLENKSVEMVVHDVNGKIMETKKINTNEPNRFGSDYSAGVYIVKVNDEGIVKTYKVVKIK